MKPSDHPLIKLEKRDDLVESSPHPIPFSDSGQSFEWQEKQLRLTALMTLVLSNFMSELVTIDLCFQLKKWTNTFR